MRLIELLLDSTKKLAEERDQLRNTLKEALADANYWADQCIAESIARAEAEQELKENEGVIAVWRRRTQKAEADLAAEQASKAAVVEALHRTCAERNEAKQQLAAEQERSKTLSTALHQAWDDRDEAWNERDRAKIKLAKLRAAAEHVRSAYRANYSSEYRRDCWYQLATALKETE